MATRAADHVFVDTNVLVYAQTTSSPLHPAATARLQSLVAAGHPLWISRQIMREYLAAMSRPGTLTSPPTMATLVKNVQDFEKQFNVAEDGPTVTGSLLSLLLAVACSGKQVHDANIVATMLAQGITRLLTHNTSDFSRFHAWISVIPVV